ncbi:MAG TPA: arginase family protein [Nitrososphaeraceae archaeon]|nr:arginase family protein [Nitrososphaeraceae archaeon]
MIKFFRSTVETLSDADIVLLGVPDESRSHARRKGTSRGPDTIRIASNETEFFEREGKIIPTNAMRGNLLDKKILDLGNAGREQLPGIIFDIISRGKMPIIIGGDHSITTIALRQIGKMLGKISLFYFDAHPDFVSSTNNYYGSIMTDSAEFINFKNSMLIGTRAAEAEEIDNATKAGLEIITPMDLAELGPSKLARRLDNKTGHKKYISIDLDCVDPAFAPGVSVPCPGGISSTNLIYLVKRAVQSGIIAMDIVELCPDFDLNNITACLAAKIISESIASINKQ